MPNHLKWIAIATIALRLQTVAAQQTGESNPAKIVGDSAAQNAAKPMPQMEKLIHALAGEWFTEERYEPSELVPKGGVGHSRDSYRIGPARSSLIEEYHSEGAAGRSWGIGIIWWDDEAQGFHDVWCDSFALDRGCRASPQVAKWEGNDFVGTDEHEVSGKRVFEKEVWSNFTPNSFTQTLYVGEAPDKLNRFLTIKAKRLSKPSALSKLKRLSSILHFQAG